MAALYYITAQCCCPGNRKEGREHSFEPTFCFIYCGQHFSRAPALKRIAAPVHGPLARAVPEVSGRARVGEKERDR